MSYFFKHNCYTNYRSYSRNGGGGGRSNGSYGGQRSYGGGGGRGGMGGAKKNPGANLTAPNWERVQLRPFKKEFYVPHPTIERRYVCVYK